MNNGKIFTCGTCGAFADWTLKLGFPKTLTVKCTGCGAETTIDVPAVFAMQLTALNETNGFGEVFAHNGMTTKEFTDKVGFISKDHNSKIGESNQIGLY